MNEKPIYAFVLMPFSSKFDDIYKIGIKEAAAQVGVIAERLDEQIFVEGMLNRIYRQIELADIILAELTDKNANVFYELGYAHAKEKLCILQTTNADDIPFDLKHYRHIVYGSSLSFLRDELIKNLEWAKREIETVRKSQIRISYRPPSGVGALITTEYTATAALKLAFDLHNETNKPSSEINAIYFYTGNRWSIFQNEKECPYIESDIASYKYRYFLTPPASRLARGSWARLEFQTTRVLARKYLGEELKDSYQINGHSLLRFATSDGNFDYEFNINVEINEIPF